jgi:uncharacterized protein YggU (UPF0235/DUF167 family)
VSGGEHAGVLVVRVSARAVGGNATKAALSALAAALGVPRGAVTLVAGASSRTKIVDITGADPAVVSRLLAGPAAPADGCCWTICRSWQAGPMRAAGDVLRAGR